MSTSTSVPQCFAVAYYSSGGEPQHVQAAQHNSCEEESVVEEKGQEAWDCLELQKIAVLQTKEVMHRV